MSFLAMITPLSTGEPTHPIAPGGPPPQIWPSPGVPIHPIYNPPYPSQGPGFPTHPIAPGGQPPGIWGGAPPYVDIGFPGPQPRPEHPIVLPPGLPPTLPDPDNRPIEWKVVWSPASGWVVVGLPTGPTPTPSK
jgi:hypothetical protein